MKVLGIERFMPANRPDNPIKGELVGILLPPGTEVKIGDILVASNVTLVNLKSCGGAEVCKTSGK